MDRPKIFIGSSTEGIEVANAIHYNLDHFAEVTIWTHGVFKLSTTIITTLVNSLNNSDFGIFVFSPDDITNLRGSNFSTVRDNVIFETGLFAGKLGIDKVFFLKPRNQVDLHLPTDLLGMVVGEYDSNRIDRSLIAATGPFCSQVRQQISQFSLSRPMEIKSTSIKSVESDESKIVNNDLKMIEVYLSENNWTMVSFQTLKENIHPKFTETYVMGLVERYPLLIRRCRLRNGTFGIKLLDKE